jgi:branched-chain amino acid transport system permease protein
MSKIDLTNKKAGPGTKSSPAATLVRQLPYILLFVAILAVPRLLFRPDANGSNYGLTVLIYVGINTILAVGLNLLMGYAGQVSLGHAAFYGLGAYASAILTVQFSSKLSYQPIPTGLVTPIAIGIAIMAGAAGVIASLRSGPIKTCLIAAVSAAGAGLLTYLVLRHAVTAGGLTPWWAMLAGVLFTCLVAYLLGVQALRLHGHYLAMATLGFGIIVTIVFREWSALTGGTSGISGLPALQVGRTPVETDLAMYYLVWIIAAIVIVIASNIVNSRVGRAFRAVHGSEIAAASVGVDASRYKVQVFVLSAALASIAGSLYAHSTTRFVSPDSFGFKVSVELVVMVVVGGMASIWGAIFGAGAVTILGERLRNMGSAKMAGLGVSMSDMDVVVFAIILMLIMIYMPSGLVRGTVDGVKTAIALARRKKKRG